MPRVLLIGSPPFAEPIREHLAGLGWLAGILTVPPKPQGRGLQRTAEPGWEPEDAAVFAPERPTSEALRAVVERVHPEAVVLASYGRILPAAALATLPRHRVNVHPSLLPRWRGAAPLPRTILAGDTETGVTLHELVEAVDAGPIVAVERVPLRGDETAGTLGPTLARLGAEMLERVLPGFLAGTVPTQPQSMTGITLAPKVRREEAVLDPARPAVELERAVRAFDPWPRARIELPDGPLLIHAAAVTPEGGPVGALFERGGKPVLGTTEGGLLLLRVQRPGRPVVDGPAFLRGYRATLPVPLVPAHGTSA